MVDLALLIPVGGVIALLAFLVCASLTPERRLTVAAFLAVPQFFLIPISVSVADVWFAFMAILALFDTRLRNGISRPVWVIISLAGMYALAQLWSVDPFSRPYMLVVVRTALFGFLIMYATYIFTRNAAALRSAIMWASPWIALQGILIILFVVNPGVENAFLRSQVGQLLVGPDAAGLFAGHENNVLDPLKAGGLFVNGNVGSMFCGAAFFVILMALSIRRSLWLSAVALVSLSGAVVSGSKTGIALAVTLPFVCVIFYWFSSNRARVAIMPLVITLFPALVWFLEFLPRIFPEYVDKSETSLGTRGELWSAAWQLFGTHPVLGLGFGGWEQAVWSLARIPGLPPHNLIIAAWAVGGVLSAVIVCTFMLMVVVSAVHRLVNAISKQSRGVLASSLCAMLWIFLHGMADNTAVYGETRTMLLAALATAVATSPIRIFGRAVGRRSEVSYSKEYVSPQQAVIQS